MSDLLRRENRARHAARRQALRLIKSRNVLDRGLWFVVDADTGAEVGPRGGVPLGVVERWLADGGYRARNGATRDS